MQVAEHHEEGWTFLALSFVFACLPPAFFFGLRMDQIHARKRFVFSAVASGVLVSILFDAYGILAGLIGLFIVVSVLARDEKRSKPDNPQQHEPEQSV